MYDKPVIFVCHSSHTKNETSLLDLLTRSLNPNNNGYELYVAELGGVELGELYAPIIDEYLARCDGALILMTRSALESVSVRREATILHFRKGESTFPLLMCLLDGVTKEEVKDHPAWAAVPLTRYEYLDKSTPSLADPDAIVKIVKIIIEWLGNRFIPGNRAVDRRARWLARRLETVGKGPLEEAAQQISFDAPESSSSRSVLARYPKTFARVLAARGLFGASAALEILLPHLHDGDAETTLDLTAMAFVDERSAQTAAKAFQWQTTDSHPAWVAVDASSAVVATLAGKAGALEARETANPILVKGVQVSTLPSGGEYAQDIEALKNEIAAAFLLEVDKHSGTALDDAVCGYLDDMSDHSVFVVVPSEIVNREMLRTLSELFPSLVIVSVTLNNPTEPTRLLHDDIVVLPEDRWALGPGKSYSDAKLARTFSRLLKGVTNRGYR